jgi:hypothetical protein
LLGGGDFIGFCVNRHMGQDQLFLLRQRTQHLRRLLIGKVIEAPAQHFAIDGNTATRAAARCG